MPIHNVADATREMKAGSKHIQSRAQAIAVGLKEERAEGHQVPPPPKGSFSARHKIQKAAFANAKSRVGSKE